MPKERSLAKRLSGGEALDSLCHQVRSHLAQQPEFLRRSADLDRLMKSIWTRLAVHGHFHSHKGYHGYSATVGVAMRENVATVEVEFRPAMSYAPPLTDKFQVPFGEDINNCSITVEIPVRPPNAVRTAAEMPLPVEVEESGQLVEKMVPAAKYKGKMKSGVKMPVTANTDTPAFKGKLEMPEGAVEEYGIQRRG
ncbi:MAG: hypothetical protein ACYCOU_00045 [Sulfobacillus sp.]